MCKKKKKENLRIHIQLHSVMCQQPQKTVVISSKKNLVEEAEKVDCYSRPSLPKNTQPLLTRSS